MPFGKFTIQPQCLSRKPLPPDKGITNELEAVSNNTLVEALRQLSCLITVANTIFSEISSECQVICDKTRSLKIRINVCEEKAEQLNAKKVQVPAGDLSVFSRLQEHYQSSSDSSPTIFTAETRPFCIQQLCKQAAITPVPFLNFLNHYYKDAKERRLMCLPVISEKNSLLEIEKGKPAYIELAREWKETERVHIVKLNEDSDDDAYRLPSPEEKLHALSLDFPSSLVSVDVTGRTFNRMASIRRSLIHVDFLIKRKKRRKRRNTICEGSSKEIQDIFPNLPSSSKSSQTDSHNNTNEEIKRANRLSNSHAKTNRRSVCSSESLYKTVDITIPRDPKKESAEAAGKNSGRKAKGRSFIPISTLSAAMSVAVKLRGNSARGSNSKKSGEEAQSSSGNWSASSSTRGSVDSAQQMENSTSQSSLGKDSLFSDNTPQDSRSHDSPLAGYVSDISAATPSPSKQPKHTSNWLQPPDREDRSRTLTPDNTCSDSASTPRILSPLISRRDLPDESPVFNDDEESVYSVDTDGYFTSMHTDSGLKNPSPKKAGERRGSQSSVSTLGNISLNSLLSRTATDCPSNSSTLTRTKRLPPVPPPRITSVKTGQVNSETSPSESDPEVQERLEKKTKIDSSRYPSMCSVSPEGSDEERHYCSLLGFHPCPDILQEKGTSPLENPGPVDHRSTSSFQVIKKPENDIISIRTSTTSKVPLIPLKYAQHITVTPLSREFKNGAADVPSPSGTLKSITPTTPNGSSVVKSPSRSGATLEPSNPVIKAKVSPVIWNKIPADTRQTTGVSMDGLSQAGRAGAKVTLDPNGKVIFASNSLGRRRDGHPLNYMYPQSPTKLRERKYATLPSRLPNYLPVSSGTQKSVEQCDGKLNNNYFPSPTSSLRKTPPTGSMYQSLSPSPSLMSQRTSQNSLERPTTLHCASPVPRLTSSGRLHSINAPRTLQPQLLKVLTQSSSNRATPPPDPSTSNKNYAQSPYYNGSSQSLLRRPMCQSPSFSSTNRHDNLYFPNYPKTGIISPPNSHHDPPKILSPVSTQNSLNSGYSSESLNSYCSSDNEITSPRKLMSNEDLFVAIHNSRKRLPGSVASDSSSTRSLSPNTRPWTPQPRNELAERGSLNLRYSSLRLPGERHSWAGDGKTPDRRSLASDRHGPNKQTSMRDFKLLLSQARSNSTTSPSSKKTAAELLKATAPPVRSPESPASLPSSPCKELEQVHNSRGDWNGLCTVPFKRGMRGRSSLQHRYDFAYPPIMEDCSEEGEVFTESTTTEAGNQYGLSKTCRKPATSTWV